MKTRIKWPKEVPHLTASNICRNQTFEGENRACLLGWCSVASKGDGDLYNRIEDELENLIVAEVGRATAFPVIDFNDSVSNPATKVASIWNRAMAKLGYTEVED